MMEKEIQWDSRPSNEHQPGHPRNKVPRLKLRFKDGKGDPMGVYF